MNIDNVFIIGKHIECTENEVYAGLCKLKDSLMSCFQAFAIVPSAEALDRVLHKLAKDLFNLRVQMVFEEWGFSAVSFDNIYSDTICYFMSQYGKQYRSEHFKIG